MERSCSLPARWPVSALPRELADRRRSNPDLDGYLYADDRSRPSVVKVALFPATQKATMSGARVCSVDLATGDVVRVHPQGTHEHPYEAMAHVLAGRLAGCRYGSP